MARFGDRRAKEKYFAWFGVPEAFRVYTEEEDQVEEVTKDTDARKIDEDKGTIHGQFWQNLWRKISSFFSFFFHWNG